MNTSAHYTHATFADSPPTLERLFLNGDHLSGTAAKRVLLNSEDVRRAIVRIAHEIVESHHGSRDLVLIGMRTRGVPMAKRLAETIRQIEGDEVPVGSLDFGLYRDDLSTRGAEISLQPSDLPVEHRGAQRRAGR